MRGKVPDRIRKLVQERAGFRCEYCKVHEDDSFLPFEVDHIISLKHGGGNELENLAYACPHCNQNKGTDIATFIRNYDDIIPIFNPRKQLWPQHFFVVAGEIVSKTRTGEATVKLLKLNEPERIIHRRLLSETGGYPF